MIRNLSLFLAERLNIIKDWGVIKVKGQINCLKICGCNQATHLGGEEDWISSVNNMTIMKKYEF